jgi:hypothetical protein
MDEYESSTNAINSILTQPVLEWANIPGLLTKVSSSPSGFAWGYVSGNLSRCELPCTGNWKRIEIDCQEILDIETDDINVYVLGLKTGGATYLYTSSSTNPNFVEIQVPFAATKIFSTHTYIWTQDNARNKQKCPKPCMMNNWIKSDDTGVFITSSSDSTLYGKDLFGNAYKTDENMQSKWSPIVGLEGTLIRSLVGKADASAIYGIDTDSKVFKFDGSTTEIDTQGYKAYSLSIEPISKQLWMTTVEPGEKGNIFSRLANPDYTTMINQISPLDKSRDELVNQMKTDYSNETTSMIVNKQVGEVIDYFKKMFSLDKNTGKKGKEQASELQQNIKETQIKLDQLTNIQPLILSFIALLLIVAIVFMLSPFLSLIILIFGIIFIISTGNGKSGIFSRIPWYSSIASSV